MIQVLRVTVEVSDPGLIAVSLGMSRQEAPVRRTRRMPAVLRLRWWRQLDHVFFHDSHTVM